MSKEPDASTLVFALRTWVGVTQEEFGRMLGVSRGRISQWETGADTPPAAMLIAMGNMAPDARGGISRPDTPHARDFFRLAGVYKVRGDLLDWALAEIMKFIRKVNADKAQIVELQSRDRGIEEQLQRAVEALHGLVPDVKPSSEIPGATEREAQALKRIYGPAKWRKTGE